MQLTASKYRTIKNYFFSKIVPYRKAHNISMMTFEQYLEMSEFDRTELNFRANLYFLKNFN